MTDKTHVSRHKRTKKITTEAENLISRYGFTKNDSRSFIYETLDGYYDNDYTLETVSELREQDGVVWEELSDSEKDKYWQKAEDLTIQTQSGMARAIVERLNKKK